MVLINIVIVIVVGAILFYLIDKYVREGRLGNLLKILVALIAAMGATGILFEAFVHTALKKRAALAKTDAAPPR
jgi:F0F1-type ATP synthase assembly protein I